jgi:hypothetical protein
MDLNRKIGRYYKNDINVYWYTYDHSLDIELRGMDLISINGFYIAHCYNGNIVQEVPVDDVPEVLRKYVESPFLEIDIARKYGK